MTRARRVLAGAAAAVLVCGLVAAASRPTGAPARVAAAPADGWTTDVGTGWEGVEESADTPSWLQAAAAAEDVVIAPPPAFDPPTEPPPPPPKRLRPEGLTAVTPKGGIWAVIIGVDDYPGQRGDLRSAVADADDADQALGRFGVPPSRRLVLRNREVTADTVRRAADWLVAHAGPKATAVFYYAGHVRELSRDTEAIVAADGQMVTDAELAAHLAPLQARHLWLVMATCFGGGFTEALGPGRVLTAAADGDSLAYENLGFGRSYLGEYLVRRGLIGGAGGTTVQDAYAYAYAALQRDYPDRLPFQVDQAGRAVSLLMGRPPASSTSSEPAPPSPDDGPEEQPEPPPTTQPPRRDPREDGDDGGDTGECAGVKLHVVDCG